MLFFIINDHDSLCSGYDHDGFLKKSLLLNCNNVSEFTPSSGYKCVHALVYTKYTQFSVYKCMYTFVT